MDREQMFPSLTTFYFMQLELNTSAWASSTVWTPIAAVVVIWKVKWFKKRNAVECNVKAVNAELSMYLHFVWQPGVRRQGDFKRYFRPNEEERMCVISILMLANW